MRLEIFQIWISIFFLFSSVAKAGVADDLRFERSDFMQSTIYSDSSKVSTGELPSGAYGTNKIWEQTSQGQFYIEEQRMGYNAIAAGIAKNDFAAIERGIRIFNYGFLFQNTDGSFGQPDAFHSTSFFVEAVAHSLLLLEASPFYKAKYQSWINLVKPLVRTSAQWMIRPEIERNGKLHNSPYTHRKFLVGAALGLTGVLTGDRELIQKSKIWIQEGILLQRPDGVNPEKGGYDSSYHAAGLVFAERYYLIVADSSIKPQLLGMIGKGVHWLQSHILPDGSVDLHGNTRTGPDAPDVNRSGKPKPVTYFEMARAIVAYDHILGSTDLEPIGFQLAKQDIFVSKMMELTESKKLSCSKLF